jgi:hypothetical protein
MKPFNRAVSTAIVLLGSLTLMFTLSWGTGGRLNREPQYVPASVNCSGERSELVDISTFEGIFGRLLYRVSNLSINTEQVAASAGTAEGTAASLAEQLQQAEESIKKFSELIVEAISKGGAAVQGTAAAAAAGPSELTAERLAALEQQLRQAEEKLKEAEKRAEDEKSEKLRLNHLVVHNANEVRSATQADMQQFRAMLASQPGILEARRKNIGAAPQRGILISAGTANQLANAFVNLHVIRHLLKCSLPVSVT